MTTKTIIRPIRSGSSEALWAGAEAGYFDLPPEVMELAAGLDARDVLLNFGDRLAAEGLRPAATATLDRVAQLAPALGTLDVDDPVAVIGAPDAIREAWLELRQLGARMAAVRAAFEAICSVHHLHDQAVAFFADTRLDPIGPAGVPPQSVTPAARHTPAGPKLGSLSRLVWLSTPEAEAWQPSVSELQARWLAWQRMVSARYGQTPVRPIDRTRAIA